MNKNIEFTSITDIYDELERCYDGCKKNGWNIGEALYQNISFYCNPGLLINNDCQMIIKKYNDSRSSGTPPYPSVNKTPASFIDAYQIIEEECQQKRIK